MARGMQVLELVGRETRDLLIIEIGIEVEKNAKLARQQINKDQLYEKVRFDWCFYIYGSLEHLEELEALSNHHVLLFNRRKGKLSSEQKSVMDGKLKQIQQIFNLSTERDGRESNEKVVVEKEAIAKAPIDFNKLKPYISLPTKVLEYLINFEKMTDVPFAAQPDTSLYGEDGSFKLNFPLSSISTLSSMGNWIPHKSSIDRHGNKCAPTNFEARWQLTKEYRWEGMDLELYQCSSWLYSTSCLFQRNAARSDWKLDHKIVSTLNLEDKVL